MVSGAFREADLELHRSALTGHCYRMMGSVTDADDAVQETMVRAWKGLERFDGRAALRSWLYRIATHVCLDMLEDRGRRNRPMETAPAGGVDDPLEVMPRTHWLEPVPDLEVVPADADPAQAAILKESVRLAFVAALQHLPPKQRAVLLLTEVLGWSAAEVAESLDTTVASVNSALQRARATLGSEPVEVSKIALSEAQSKLLEQYVDAFHRYDLDALVGLLHQDVVLSMPPYALWLRGPQDVRAWLEGRGSVCKGSRLVPVQANGSPAFAQYHPAGDASAGLKAWALIVLELDASGQRITGWSSFLDTERLFPRFGLPLTIAT